MSATNYPAPDPVRRVLSAVRQVVEAHDVGITDEERAMRRLEEALLAWEQDILRRAGVVIKGEVRTLRENVAPYLNPRDFRVG